MPPRKLYFENVRVGDELPAMAKTPIDRVQLARYAGATNDYNPSHIDENHARSLGLPSVFAPSTLGMGFLGQLISDWARGARVRRLSCRFTKIVWPSDTLVCKGRVSDRAGVEGRYTLELDTWAENQKGELVLKGQATLQVYYSAEDENRSRAGQPPVVVNVPGQSILAPQPAAPEAKGKPSAKGAAAKKPKPAKAKKPVKAKKPAPKPKKAKPAPKKAKKKK
jgi:acyl dehydratase